MILVAMPDILEMPEGLQWPVTPFVIPSQSVFKNTLNPPCNSRLWQSFTFGSCNKSWWENSIIRNYIQPHNLTRSFVI